jgi:hypothetical protein
MHRPGGTATYAYSAMFMVLVRCGLLLPSSPEHYTADTVQQWRAVGGVARSGATKEGRCRAGAGISCRAAVYGSAHIGVSSGRKRQRVGAVGGQVLGVGTESK